MLNYGLRCPRQGFFGQNLCFTSLVLTWRVIVLSEHNFLISQYWWFTTASLWCLYSLWLNQHKISTFVNIILIYTIVLALLFCICLFCCFPDYELSVRSLKRMWCRFCLYDTFNLIFTAVLRASGDRLLKPVDCGVTQHVPSMEINNEQILGPAPIRSTRNSDGSKRGIIYNDNNVVNHLHLQHIGSKCKQRTREVDGMDAVLRGVAREQPPCLINTPGRSNLFALAW